MMDLGYNDTLYVLANEKITTLEEWFVNDPINLESKQNKYKYGASSSGKESMLNQDSNGLGTCNALSLSGGGDHGGALI
jgi:hypothetical protein